MKRLILVRHGDYGNDKHLNLTGRNQMINLAFKIRGIIEGTTALILSSPVTRARESAEVLTELLGIASEVNGLVTYGRELVQLLKLVKTKGRAVDVLILVTHLPLIERFPSYFGKHELGLTIPLQSLDKGGALVIGCDEGTLSYF